MSGLTRRSLLALALAVPLAATGCSAHGPAAPRGWDRVAVGDLSLSVPTGWSHGPVDTGIGVFTDAWREDGGNGHLLAAGPVGATTAEEALAAALDALRTSVPGLRPTTTSAQGGEDSLTVACLDLATERTELGSVRLWALEEGASCAAVLLGAHRLDESVRTTVEESLRISPRHDGPSAPGGWTRVGRGGASLSVPSAWSAVGALAGSQRWTAGWGDVDADGAARALVLLCPETREASASDALAQIESDCVAGSVPAFERDGTVEALSLDEEGLDALRLPFTYGGRDEGAGRGSGVLWTLQRSRGDGEPLVCAVLATLTAGLDTALLSTVEEGLWLAGSD
ncbi:MULTISPECIES: hypothetical protein [unclassified Actinomyces]|uniref:hypothetical protein n=1 Tax=unclassified Actinomyces TaxID=2609248 RepID=UPI0020172B08|nr:MULTISPECIES: hypothetical protein [unclassified Actinomyces]MCL3777066.1 hypothetical protein [Actinomyces sp. AC-20-1]MCL3790286.1 hypothetical protein [Actinomyces sp. 187325]MCL3791287.1 hypothetical protein [Actinomyces sp. 186855]MCL3793790.1 hypothetical protein [Actinomyces sp. 217892]